MTTNEPLHDSHDINRRVVGIVFTDIVRSTNLLYELNTKVWMEVLSAHFARAGRLIAQYEGRQVGNTGDGILATFPLATRALLFSRDVVDDPGDKRIAVRAGIHWGNVTESLDAALVAGRAVHFAARVIEQAAGSGIWVSDEAKSRIEVESPEIASAAQWSVQDDCQFKGIPGVHRVWRVT